MVYFFAQMFDGIMFFSNCMNDLLSFIINNKSFVFYCFIRYTAYSVAIQVPYYMQSLCNSIICFVNIYTTILFCFILSLSNLYTSCMYVQTI